MVSWVSKDSDIPSPLRRESECTSAAMRMISCKSKITRTPGLLRNRGHSQGPLTLFPWGTSASLWDRCHPQSLTKHNFDLHMSQKLHQHPPTSNVAPQHANRKPKGLRVLFYPGSKSQPITSHFFGHLESGAHLRSSPNWAGELSHVA